MPHISLVFREMWVYRKSFGWSSVVDPHLAKNERDVGHPSFLARDTAKDPLIPVPFIPPLTCRMQVAPVEMPKGKIDLFPKQ